MKIAVIGAGAMGSIYGGHLSLHNDVTLIDTNQTVVETIRKNGLKIQENGVDNLYHPGAAASSEGMEPVDLVILFVKALYSRTALAGNRNIIGPDTYVMTLQNGAGHEDILREFVAEDRIIIGTTEDNGAVLDMGYIRHGGVGNTNIGMLVEDQTGILERIKDAFDSCGFHTRIHKNIQQLIWDKLFTNISLSAVTAVLQVNMGYIAANQYAWNMAMALLHEAVETAHALGLEADEKELAEKIRKTSEGSPNGVTSICADVRAGRRTEVDTISGSVVRAAKKAGVPVPVHEFVVNTIHALEGRQTK